MLGVDLAARREGAKVSKLLKLFEPHSNISPEQHHQNQDNSFFFGRMGCITLYFLYQIFDHHFCFLENISTIRLPYSWQLDSAHHAGQPPRERVPYISIR
jgi:hypothetical protein